MPAGHNEDRNHSTQVAEIGAAPESGDCSDAPSQPILTRPQWEQRANSHRVQVSRWTEPFRARRRINQSHPVHDFLFVYYQYSPSKLEQWHPGIGVRLSDAVENEVFGSKHYRTLDGYLLCDPRLMKEKEAGRLRWIADLLRQTQANRGNFSCLGLHEWAMVYQGHEIRHEKTTRLRLPQEEIDHIVESRAITCTHFDAFRFFAESAKPLNRVLPTLEQRPLFEQPACIHANMDLYKWAFKSMPWIGSDLVLRCFDLAMAARAVDMRASPYDLSEYKIYEPIKIETAEGRSLYEKLQREIADRARLLRIELAEKIEYVLSIVERPQV